MTEGFSRITADDGQTFVVSERGEGSLVVLIHGFPDTPYEWEPTATRLAEAGYRTVAPWLRGYQPETTVEGLPYDAMTIGSDPVRLLDALGEREAIIVGHDWGAAISYSAASLHPDRIRAIVPIAIPHPSLLPRNARSLWAARHFIALKMPWAEGAVRRSGFAYIEKLYSRWAPDWSGPDRDRAIADVKRVFADGRNLHEALNYYRALSFSAPPREIARPPSVRALAVGGTTDLLGASGVYERTAELLGEGSESLVVRGAGHWPHREDEEQFHTRLLAFLAESCAAGLSGGRSAGRGRRG